MSVYIFAATYAEARACRRVSRTGSKHASGTNKVKILVTGIGPVAARAAAIRAVAELQGDAGRTSSVFVVCGTCGGLTPDLRSGAVVVYTACLTTAPGGRPVEPAPVLAGRVARGLTANRIQLRNVVGITSPAVAAAPAQKRHLASQGASVVDMESYEIVSAALEAGVSSVVVRAVSDSVGLKVPDFTRAIKADGSVDRLRAARIALGSPLGAARLMAAERCALQNLRKALEAIWTCGYLDDHL